MKPNPAHQLLALLLVAMLGACGSGSKQKTTEPENPYNKRAANHIHNGLAAMQDERWTSAEASFARALKSSRLADDTDLIIQSWYNLAVVHTAMKNNNAAEQAYQRVIELARRYQKNIMKIRAQLALALLQQRTGTVTEINFPEQFPSSLFKPGNWPADIHLQAARLAQLLGQKNLAEQAYQAVSLKKGNQRILQKMKAEAHMGLALLAKTDNNHPLAWEEAEQSLFFCRNIGAPRLTAHALLLQGSLPLSTEAKRRDKLERALNIYTVLADKTGQKKSLTWLIQLSDIKQRAPLQLRLELLGDKLGKDADKAEVFPARNEEQ